MAAGDKVLGTKPRADSNERFDLVDFLALAVTAQSGLEGMQRALVSSPKATVGLPTGERWSGSLTINPTSGSDGLFRIDTVVFVGLDANGGLVLKPAGTTLSVAIPAGGSSQQVYAYMADVTENPQVRRFIPATTPFTEFVQAINVASRQTCNLYVRAGVAGTVVAEDVVSGVTRSLLFLGICTNTGGVVAFTPAANTLETVTVPTTLPTANTGTTVGATTVTGSQASLRELVNAALYQIGQLGWRGSRNVVPSAANNFQAYSSPSVGIDALFDSPGESTTTPITVWRSWNLKRRSVIDHNGYRMGAVTELDEAWCVPATRTWCYTTFGAALVGGAGGGFNIAADKEALTLNATGQIYGIGLVPQTEKGFSLLIMAANVNRTVGTDFIRYRVYARTSVPLLKNQIMFIDNDGVTGNVVHSIPFGGSINQLSIQQGQSLEVTMEAVPVTGVNQISLITMQVIVDPPGWIFTGLLSTELVTPGPAVERTYSSSPTASLNQACFSLLTPGSASFSGVKAMTTELYECLMNGNVSYVQEWMVNLQAITAAVNNRNFALGVQNNDGGAGTSFIYFFNSNTTANWQLRVVGIGGLSTVDTDTGVAVAQNTTYRMRLEINGANTSTSGVGSFRIRGYLNGVKVADVISAALPLNDVIRPYFHIGNTSLNGGPFNYSVGRVRRVFNHLLDGDNL